MVRKLEKSDRNTFILFARAFYASEAVSHSIPNRYHVATFEQLMASNTYAEGYMLEYDGKPAGYALTAKTFSQEAGGMVVWLEELFVLPQYRGKGLGHEFFDYMRREIEPHAARIRLEVEPDNTRAIDLYRRQGFCELPYGQMIKELQ